jgi:menaquinone-dependent protoporphyrinogen IX oxidase
MKIGIIVHSQTGHNLAVAEALKAKLATMGHTANIERINPVDPKQTDPKNIKLEKLPDLGAYDALVLAAPVQAFSLSNVMKAYLPQLPALNGKKAAIFVTKGLPFNWTGGNSSVSAIKKAVESKGGVVVGSELMAWGGDADREKRIAELIDRLSKLF